MADNNIIMKAIGYIEENLDDKLSLDKVAGKVGYSKFHLNRLFFETVGCTLYKYIQTRRLTKAADKLVNTKESIIDIAYDANYGSQQSFTFAFRKLYFCTPQKYRMIGVHIPKLNRFTISSVLVMKYKSVKKHGDMAA